jgi:uncharacterized protein YjbJ (UPF0337 family)
MSERVEEMKARAKQAAGDLSDDRDLKREGQIEEAGAKGKGKIDDAADRAKDGVDRLTGKTHRAGHGG